MTIAVNLITGFLGAGKTTVISALLAQRPAHERWAVLVNEFGRIGIDQAAWDDKSVLVKAVPGGCMCCAQNLPMQIALGQISSEAGITRLLIEPSGLGHPLQIRETLTAAHWQHYFAMAASICVVDGAQLADDKLRSHETFLAQVAIADVLILTKNDVLTDAEKQRAEMFASAQLPAKTVFCSGQTAQGVVDVAIACLDVVPIKPTRLHRSLLHIKPTAAVQASQPVIEVPYHYHEQALSHEVGGWVFSADWQFNHDALMTLFMLWQGENVSRIKGVLHTDKGWLFFNAEAAMLSVRSSEYRADNRLELISLQARDWAYNEQQLLSCLSSPT